MGLFGKKKAPPVRRAAFSLEEYEPVLRCSICTGEQVACMRNRQTGQLREVMLIRSTQDLEEFCRTYQVAADQVRKVY